ncbi:MAG: acyl carrier protein [Thermoguttaceae bacterium]
MNNLNETILAVVRGVVKEKSPDITDIRPDQLLVEDLGLRSLDLARIIAKLEVKLDADPFAELVSVTSVRTPGDLCAAYAKCFAEEGESETPAEPEPTPRARPNLQSQRELRQKARE